MIKELYDIKSLSQILNVKESWIRMAIFKKEIPYIKIGRLIRFDSLQIQSWITDKKNVKEVKNGK